MHTARCGAFFVLAVLSLFSLGSAQTKHKIEAPEELKDFATRPCFPMYGKGGVGIVNEHLFVLTKTPHNELILQTTKDGADQKWRGKTAAERQVVFLFGGKLWEANALPQDFNLGESVIISFEGEKIRIFDFEKEQGCYYLHSSSE